MSNKWINEKTLGGKAKEFKWTFDSIDGLKIRPNFIKDPEKSIDYTLENLEKLMNFVFINKRVPLANNVDKLGKGIEQDGLGKFLYDEFNENIEIAMSSSQLAAILVSIDVFDYNEKKRNMEFWLKNIDFIKRLSNEINELNKLK